MGNLSPISTLVFIPHELELLMGQLYKDFYITLQCGRLVTHREMKEGLICLGPILPLWDI